MTNELGQEPAFPNKRIKIFPNGEVHENAIEYGLTKREWFAGMAMIGIVSGRYANPDRKAVLETTFDGVRDEAYKLADAMLAEVNK